MNRFIGFLAVMLILAVPAWAQRPGGGDHAGGGGHLHGGGPKRFFLGGFYFGAATTS